MRNGILAGCLMLLTATSFACEKEPLIPPKALAEADMVFRGVVENLVYLDNPEKSKTDPRVIVTIGVKQVWKGPAQQVVTLHTTHNRTGCNGYEFKAGKEYLVYSRYNHRADTFLAKLFAPKVPTLGVKTYGGTKSIESAEEDLKFLGNGSAR